MLTPPTGSLYPEHMRLAGAMAILLAAALCASCGTPARGYVVADAAMLEVLGGERALAAACRTPARERGLELVTIVGTDEKATTAAIESALADARCRAVLVLSTAAVDLRQYALGRPEMLFAAYGERGPAGPENYLLLVAERGDAYRAAGRKLGNVLAKQTSTGAAVVGILAVSPTGTAEREIGQFQAGLEETAPGATTIRRESRSVTDKAGALRAVRELRAEGAGYFLLKAYGLTTACLEELGGDSAKAIVEDCGGRADCGARVLMSVETDWPGTFTAVFREMLPGATGWSSPELREAWRLAGDEGGR